MILVALTEKEISAMLKKLHKRNKLIRIDFEPNEGERTLLCSNKGGMRSPSLDYLDTSAKSVTEDLALEYLSQIISMIYLKEYHGFNSQEGSNILPGIDKRTG